MSNHSGSENAADSDVAGVAVVVVAAAVGGVF
jgi:hypothetical protein